MNKSTIRATAAIGTTRALVIAGAATVAAAGPRDRDEYRGSGGQRMGGMGMGDMRVGPAFGGMRGLDADWERAERTIQTSDGTSSVRLEQGVVDSAAANSLTFSLASGEAVTVAIDDDTRSLAYEEQEFTSRRGWTHSRLAPTEIEITEIEAGAEIVVWSDSEDDADFVASRVVVKPADTELTEDTEAAEDTGTADSEAVPDTAEDATATDA